MAKKTNIYAENDIKTMDLDSEVLKILLDNDIKTVGSLWELNRKKLKAMGVKDSDIKQIIIKLQLLGLDLNKRIYS
jgi:mevalonate kinase